MEIRNDPPSEHQAEEAGRLRTVGRLGLWLGNLGWVILEYVEWVVARPYEFILQYSSSHSTVFGHLC